VNPEFDPLLGKLVVYAGTREEAIRKLNTALWELVIQGVENNTAEFLKILEDERFRNGKYRSDFFN
jgi:acetyl-CoA carboxylase biotin carboxylase subunit